MFAIWQSLCQGLCRWLIHRCYYQYHFFFWEGHWHFTFLLPHHKSGRLGSVSVKSIFSPKPMMGARGRRHLIQPLVTQWRVCFHQRSGPRSVLPKHRFSYRLGRTWDHDPYENTGNLPSTYGQTSDRICSRANYEIRETNKQAHECRDQTGGCWRGWGSEQELQASSHAMNKSQG